MSNDIRETERQAFEAWARDWGFMNEHHRYVAWEGWQAARAASPVAEGWKLVPVEPTDAMRLAGGHVNSEWLNDNAPIGEARYVMPMIGVWAAMLAASPPAPPTPQQAVAYRFGDLLCRLLECEELGPFTDRMPASLLREWQEATDEHIDAAAQPPTPQPPQGAQQEPKARGIEHGYCNVAPKCAEWCGLGRCVSHMPK
jgi:hypothetical protein